MSLRYKQEIKASGLTQKLWYRTIYLHSDHWKCLRQKKLEADGKFCQIRGENCLGSKNLDVHHVAYKHIYDVELSDLQVVCRNCHERLHSKNTQKKKNKKHKLFAIKRGQNLALIHLANSVDAADLATIFAIYSMLNSKRANEAKHFIKLVGKRAKKENIDTAIISKIKDMKSAKAKK